MTSNTSSWATAPGAVRAKYLRAIAAIVTERKSELARLESLDSGKPLEEAAWDIDDVAGCFEYNAELAEALDKNQKTPISIPMDTMNCHVLREPIGVVGLITPWTLFKWDDLGMEIMRIAFPAALALAADPIASLIDTIFIGRLGPVDIAGVGVSIAIFNQISKVAIYPLVNITTSFVAEEDTLKRLATQSAKIDELEKCSIKNNNIITNEEPKSKDHSTVECPDACPKENQEEDCKTATCESAMETKSNGNASKWQKERRQIPSASTALIVGGLLGLFQTLFIIFLEKPILGFMGVKHGSPMLVPARKYLLIRALGSPAVAFSLAMQGVFRGFKDTKTPLFATVVGDTANIILDPILIFTCHLGVSGAAIAHVISQYLISIILLCRLIKKVELMPLSSKVMPFRKFLKSGSLILTRVLAATICVTLAASRAARLGPTSMAAFQICLQIWLTSSLLADGLAVAGQAILACAFAEKDYEKASRTASRVLQMGLVLGLGLGAAVGLGIHFGDIIFSKDKRVLHILATGIPVIVAILSIGCLFLLSKTYGFIGIWIALSLYMVLRTFAGVLRVGSGTGPWRYLKRKSISS